MFLSNEQRQIVETKEPRVVVCAAAATGKTTTIIERLRFLLKEGVDPKKIVAITFTNNAAEEMRERLGRNYSNDLFIGTIHGYANKILRDYGIETSSFLTEDRFDELFSLIKEYPNCVQEVEHLIVDETQDSDNIQFEFFLNTIKPKNWMLVGDWRQSIYSFKDANPTKLLELSARDDVSTFYLKENYRNSYSIHRFSANILKSLSQEFQDNSVLKRTSYGEVIKTESLLNEIGDFFSKKVDEDEYGEWFVLCRTNKEVEDIAFVLKKRGVPCSSFKQADLTLSELQKKLKDNTVKVLTIHSAKGLESKNVIVIGARFWNDEERRISYVAATRARDRLIWTSKPKKKNKKRG